MLDAATIKANGVHYTPAELAAFLAEVTIRHAPVSMEALSILDPACGDGSLLKAIARIVPAKVRKRMQLVGYETDPEAASSAASELASLGVSRVDIRLADFLDRRTSDCQWASSEPLFVKACSPAEQFDLVISNPPYVRTQVLGWRKSRRLAKHFGLTGRVDLYHAFVKAISIVLRPGGVLGLLTSNRFMLIQSGAAIRRLLNEEFQLCDLYDLGDTKLFDAAVLPAIVVARARLDENVQTCSFTRVYEARKGPSKCYSGASRPSILSAIGSLQEGLVRSSEGEFQIERGELNVGPEADSPWTLMSDTTRVWLKRVHGSTSHRFGEIAKIRVGIKTTADSVFIRDDWSELPEDIRPERNLLKPVITHHAADRWMRARAKENKAVLYPHEQGSNGEKRAIDLEKYPRAKAYLEQRRGQLEGRRYVLEAGRNWYEIWVPQSPAEWTCDKIVYPDISEGPRFFLDTTRAVVNGDCYWIVLINGVNPDWKYLLLGVANSTFTTTYYDTMFHNKLYSGRRRFMTQYVRQFPLPDINKKESRKIIEIVSKGIGEQSKAYFDESTESELDQLVWSSFGLTKKRLW